MKYILVIVPTDKVAGAEGILKKIALEMKRRNYIPLIVYLSRGDNNAWPEIEASNRYYINAKRESVGFIKALFFFLKLRLKGIIFEYSFTSHIHCNAYISVLKALKLLKVKNIVFRESTTPFLWYEGLRLASFKIMYKLYRKPDVLICQTKQMQENLLENLPHFLGINLTVLDNPVDYLALRNKRFDNIAKSIFKRTNNEIVCVGRLVPEKGYRVLLTAFKIALVNYPDLHLRILGSGPERELLETLAIKLRVKERVIFHGHCTNPIPYMREARLCVVSSIVEGFPNVLLEKMSVGRRVVSTECADGVNKLPGIYTCPVNAPEQLAETICTALSANKQLFYKNIRSMRKYVKNRTVKTFVSEVLGLVNEKH